MDWRSCHIAANGPFSFAQCLVVLRRSSNEVMYRVIGDELQTVVVIDGQPQLCHITGDDSLHVRWQGGATEAAMRAYMTEWFDLDYDLASFTFMPQYRGLRLVGIPDLFEALTWAIIGQQINLSFAYTLKRRFVEQFGTRHDEFWCYPTAERIALVTVDELIALQFSRRKAEYMITAAKAQLTKETVTRETLLQLRGVGPWTADYVMMKCKRERRALLVGDAGLQQALTAQFGRKLTPVEIEAAAEQWHGAESYWTYYLWRSLYE